MSARRSLSRAALSRSKIWATVSKARAASASARESLISRRPITESKWICSPGPAGAALFVSSRKLFQPPGRGGKPMVLRSVVETARLGQPT